LDNAIKYCAKPPQILISTANEKKGINIMVKDNGIGITSKAQTYIFEKFYRVETGNIHTVKGFGLGLSYVKNIVTAHKGSIQISSQLNNGSEFSLFFPVI
jgi:two-component system phosphate regulon sensor histidine kinase PhoR